MKQVFTKTIAELKKSYTTFAVFLIFIASVSSFFTTIQIFKDNDLRTILQMLYVASSANRIDDRATFNSSLSGRISSDYEAV